MSQPAHDALARIVNDLRSRYELPEVLSCLGKQWLIYSYCRNNDETRKRAAAELRELVAVTYRGRYSLESLKI